MQILIMDEKRNFSCKLHVRTEELKANFGTRSTNRNYFHDSNSWSELQELQKLYKKLLLSDIEYAIEKKVEIDLWNYCFKDYITYLQLQVRNTRNTSGEISGNASKAISQSSNHGGVRRAAEVAGVDPNITLQWFLEMASGFFILLLEEVCTTFDLDLPFLKRGYGFDLSTFNATNGKSNTFVSEDLREKLNYIYQFCLVHLGDVSRYQNQLKQAEVFYRQAIEISPISGHAYNQIALLHANAGNNLSAIAYYIKSIALEQSFPAASANLAKMFANLSTPSRNIQIPSISKSNFVREFLRFHAFLHEARNLKIAHELCSILNEALTSLIATESLTTLQLLQMTVITIFQINRVSVLSDEASDKYTNGNATTSETLSTEEIIIRKLLAESMAGMLNAFLLPVYTLMQGKSLLTYFALPPTKVLLDWITLHPETLQEAGFLKRLQIWPSLCRVLNELSTSLRENKKVDDAYTSELKYYPLPEDYDLRAFLPLQKRISIYRHSKVTRQRPIKTDKILVLRAKRILELGRIFSNIKMTDRQNIIKLVENVDRGDKVELFEAVEHVIPKAFNDGILNDLENLCLNKEFSSVKLDGGLKANNTEDESGTQTFAIEEINSENSPLNLPESTPSDEQNSHKQLSIKRAQRTNVAMAAILRQAAATDTISSGPIKETSIQTKQVKFKAPSPSPSNSLQDSPYFQKCNTLQDKNIPKGNMVEGAQQTDVLNRHIGMLFGQNANHKKDINHSVRHPIDFSIPPPSIPQRTISSRRDVTEDRMIIHSDSHNIAKVLSESLLPSRNNQIHQHPPFSHDQQQTAIIDNRPPLFGGSLPFPVNQLQKTSSLWQNSRHPTPNNNINSHSENQEQLLYQLPQFGGLNKLDQTLPKQSLVINPASGADPRGLQFQHPYPSNEVRTEIKSASSDAALNRSSPMYHRLFSMDPTWSVTPGSLPPSTSENTNLLVSHFGNRSNVNLTNIPNSSTFNEMQRLDISEQEHSVKNKHKSFQAKPST